ncbi:hypothetical protein B1207_08385 [Legionella quinlivanii]|uniref:Uncharacterized protein n=1 Tax=Legionella quinlivanii TaxID=45073 RepID=A0A364LJY0_9GAMM|nr:hypothetical protein [Legionella quinlivanii]RAP36805.1 hypothetical protein B1207_08385 [Legionella quinlivanii]
MKTFKPQVNKALDAKKREQTCLAINKQLGKYQHFKLDEILSLPDEELVALENFLQDIFTNKEILRRFNVTMLYHFSKIQQLRTPWSGFCNFSDLASLSKDGLGFLLNFVLQSPHRQGSMQLAFAEALVMVKSLRPAQLAFLHSLPCDFYPLVLKDNTVNLKTLNLLCRLSASAKTVLFSQTANGDLFHSIQSIAQRRFIDSERLELLFNSHYILSKESFSNSPELDILLNSKLPAEQLKPLFWLPKEEAAARIPIILSAQGVECHRQAYCDFLTQLEVCPEILSFYQQFLLNVKRPSDEKERGLFSSPQFVKAYKKNFFDIDYLTGCTTAEMKLLANCCERASQKSIRNVWDPRFAAFMRAQETQASSNHRLMPAPSPICAAPKACIKSLAI